MAHPCDDVSLESAVEAARLGFVQPILVGPFCPHPRRFADRMKLDISSFELVDAEHSVDSAMKAVQLVSSRQGRGPDEGQPAHRRADGRGGGKREAGIRTARRISHCFIMDVPDHDDALIITDAAVNIAPTWPSRSTSCRTPSTSRTPWAWREVRVAILSAMETVNPKVPSTIEAAALCKMADRGQITGALLDGPLALDNAIDPERRRASSASSRRSRGRANVLVVPDLEAGNMLAKSLSFLAAADAAGIVLGARVPIVLTSRADSRLTRLASTRRRGPRWRPRAAATFSPRSSRGRSMSG